MKILFPIAILVMGFSGLVAQIVLLRELLIVFSGNELCIGIILANSLILEAFGSYYIGKRAETSKNSLESFTLLTIFFSLSLLVAILVIRIMKRMMGISIGESVGFIPMVYASFLILMPVSIIHGALFTYSCRIYSMFSDQSAAGTGKVYAYETIGTIIGGIICTYLLIPRFTSFQTASWLALVNFITCLALFAPYRKMGGYRRTVLAAVGITIVGFGYFLFSGLVDKLHNYSITWQWKNQNIIHYQNSPYGNISITENQGQYTFFLDGVPHLITPVPDIPFVEEFVHIPLLSHPNPTSVFILSGGAGGIINEILKHPSIDTIEYAELDPLILDLIRKFRTPLTETELNSSKVQIKEVDGRMLLRTTEVTYDVIFVGIQEPSNLQTNRFFTKEFFSLAEQKLNDGGIFVIGLPGSLDYLNEELVQLNSCIFNTLGQVFPQIRVIPGDGTNLYLASHSPDILMIDQARVVENLIQRNMQTERGLPRHIQQKLHPGWQAWSSRFLAEGTDTINNDFKPLGVFYSISHWNALYAPSLRAVFRTVEQVDIKKIGLLVFASLLLFLLFLTRKRRFFQQAIAFSIVTTGFAGMIFDLMVIFIFQVLYGYVFSWIGVLVASFMAGAASGALAATTAMTRMKNCFKLYVRIELMIICFSVGFPMIFFALHTGLTTFGYVLFKILILVISLISGFLTGSQFPLANQLYLKNSKSLSGTAGLLYASDLLGGWLGGIIAAVLLLPVLGLAGTCISVGLLKVTSFLFLITQAEGNKASLPALK